MTVDNILENIKLETEKKEKLNPINPSELTQKINEVAYSRLRKINDLKKQQRALEAKIEAEEKSLDDFISWISEQISIGWEQGYNMTEQTKDYTALLRKWKDIVYIGLLDYWGRA